MPSLKAILDDFEKTTRKIETASLDERGDLVDRLFDLVRVVYVLGALKGGDLATRPRLLNAASRVAKIDQAVWKESVTAARPGLRAQLEALVRCEELVERFIVSEGAMRAAVEAELRQAFEELGRAQAGFFEKTPLSGAGRPSRSEGVLLGELGARSRRAAELAGRGSRRQMTSYSCASCKMTVPPVPVSTGAMSLCGCGGTVLATVLGRGTNEYCDGIAEAEIYLQQASAATDERKRLAAQVHFQATMRFVDRALVALIGAELTSEEAALVAEMTKRLMVLGLELDRVRTQIPKTYARWAQKNS